MSLGIYSFLFFLIALPGIIFRRFYYQGEFSNQFYPKQLIISLFYSFIIGIFIIYLSFLFYNNFLSSIFNFNPISKDTAKSVLNSIFSGDSSTINLLDNLFNSSFVLKFFILSLIIIFISWLLAITTYHLVRELKLDIKIKSLSFDNHWYYYFRGEFLRFKDFNVKFKKIDLVTADILVKIDDHSTILYRGAVKQYYLDKTSNKIETIHLSDTSKEDSDGNSKKIPGHCFIIPFEKVININLKVAYTTYQNSSINVFIKKHQLNLMVIFLLLPYSILLTPLSLEFENIFIAISLLSIFFMMIPSVFDVLSDKNKNSKDKISVIIGYFFIGLITFGIYKLFIWISHFF